jgi:hypothetical protein
MAASIPMVVSRTECPKQHPKHHPRKLNLSCTIAATYTHMAHTPHAGPDTEEDYGDDFEDYDICDFDEQVELQAQAAPKQQISTLTGASKKKHCPGPLGDLEAIQDALKNENSGMANRAARIAASMAADDLLAAAKGVSRSGFAAKGSKPSKGSKGAGAKSAKYAAAGPANPLGSNLAVSPAAKRANGLRAHIALVSERYAAFDQPPLTEHQLYRLRLRTAGPSFKECTTASKLLIDGPFYWALQLGVQLAQKTTSSIRRCSVK